ncbi:hypothetical protein GX586_14730 [bacterium]|nr:hypothetical protein [bacterium]
MRTSARILRFLALLAVASIGIAALMFARTTSLTGPFALEPSEQWLVRQDQPGEVTTQHRLARSEVMQSVRVYEFARQDIISISLASNLTEGALVASNTPVMELYSQNDEAMERMLVARVERLKSQLELLSIGEGSAKVDAAQANLALAQTNLATYLPIYERRKKLVVQGIMSPDEFQLTEDEYSRRAQAVNVAQADVDVRRMQIAPGVVTMAAAELEETQQQLELIRARLDSRWLRTPIGGRLTRNSNNPAILIRVMNEKEMLARIMIPMVLMDQVRVGEQVELYVHGVEGPPITAAVDRVLVDELPLLGQSVANLVVPLDNSDGRLQVAMSGQAVIRGARINPVAALWRRLWMAGINTPARGISPQ